jgi:hypothetical protein
MSISGSGVGGNIGGPIQPTIEELRATAFTMVSKDLLGISNDTLQRPVSDVDRDGYLMYRSPASRPNLNSPLEYMRMAAETAQPSDAESKTVYDKLVNYLPDDVQQELSAQNQLPLTERDTNFAVLNNVLNFAAQTFASINKAAQPIDPASIDAVRTATNLSLPLVTLGSATLQSDEITSAARQAVLNLGPNNANYDTLMNYVNQSSAAVSGMKDITSSIVNSPSNNINSLQPGIDSLSKSITTLAASFSSQQNIQELQILNPTLNSMALATGALTLNSGAQPLFIGLNLASVGLSSDTSSLALMGSSLNSLNTSIASGLSNHKPGVPTAGSSALLQGLVATTVFTSATFASLLSENGIGALPTSDPVEIAQAKQFTLDLMLSLAFNSGLAATAFNSFAQTVSNNSQSQQMISGNLQMASLLTMIITTQANSKISANALLDSITAPMIDYFEKVSAQVNEQIHEENMNADIAQGIESYNQLSIYLQQAILALEDRNFDELNAVLHQTLASVGVDPELLNQDLKGVQEFAHLILNILTQGIEEQTNNMTGMSQAA